MPLLGYMLAGDSAQADPVCAKSEHYGWVEQAVQFARRAERHDESLLFFLSAANSIAR